MSQKLRLPPNWTSFSVYKKMQYLVNTNQARNFSAAASLLSARKEQLKQEKKDRNEEAFKTVRLPYPDN